MMTKHKSILTKDQVDEIIRRVAYVYGVLPQVVQSRSRQQPATEARHMAMTICWKRTGSQIAVARMFGRKSHGTIAHAVRTIRGRLETDPEINLRFEALADLIKPPKPRRKRHTI